MGTRGKQAIDYSVANVMLRHGATQQEVADRFGVTQSAVAIARARGRIKEGTTLVQGAIPWQLRPEHVSLNAAKMLRCAARLERGESVGPSNRDAVAQFVAGLEKQDAVIHYEPDLAPYFFRVPRRQGVDTWLVRDPHTDDRGRPRGRVRSG